MCMGMKAGLDNKGRWLAWGIDKIYERINKGMPPDRQIGGFHPSDVGLE